MTYLHGLNQVTRMIRHMANAQAERQRPGTADVFALLCFLIISLKINTKQIDTWARNNGVKVNELVRDSEGKVSRPYLYYTTFTSLSSAKRTVQSEHLFCPAMAGETKSPSHHVQLSHSSPSLGGQGLCVFYKKRWVDFALKVCIRSKRKDPFFFSTTEKKPAKNAF